MKKMCKNFIEFSLLFRLIIGTVASCRWPTHNKSDSVFLKIFQIFSLEISSE